jgi:hypothetical protein
MTHLEKYERVNQAESLKELANIIRSFADEDGKIQGRRRMFDAELMAKACEVFSPLSHDTLTREFGIRQQAMMIYFYEVNFNFGN